MQTPAAQDLLIRSLLSLLDGTRPQSRRMSRIPIEWQSNHVNLVLKVGDDGVTTFERTSHKYWDAAYGKVPITNGRTSWVIKAIIHTYLYFGVAAAPSDGTHKDLREMKWAGARFNNSSGEVCFDYNKIPGASVDQITLPSLLYSQHIRLTLDMGARTLSFAGDDEHGSFGEDQVVVTGLPAGGVVPFICSGVEGMFATAAMPS